MRLSARKIFLFIAVLLLVLLIASPWIFANLYVSILKRNLDNPIVNNNYRGWGRVNVDENISVCLPEDWVLQSTEEGLAIFDPDENVIAIGTKADFFPEGSLTNFLSSYYGSMVVSNHVEISGSGDYGNYAGVYISSTQYEDGSERSLVVLYLPYSYEYEYRLCFVGNEDARFVKEAEAIAWSMKYSK
ncbi:MAG: hypothetical protein ACI3VZ_00560 [Faecousia sp.]